jgi:hypothetical protein
MESLQPVLLDPNHIFERHVAQLMRFIHEINAIQAIGWFEHTSDWDPYLIIEMIDLSIQETSPGYAEFKITDSEGNEPPEGTISEDAEEYCSHIQVIDHERTLLVPITRIRSLNINH